MKSVALLLIVVLVAQNLESSKQIKTLAGVLLASSLVALGYTAWQYTAGIGVKLVETGRATSLARAGLCTGDIIESINGRRIRTPQELSARTEDGGTSAHFQLRLLRGEPLRQWDLEVSRASLVDIDREVAQGNLKLYRGYPPRAQGFYGHWTTYADVLVEIGLLGFGLFMACPAGHAGKKLLSGLVVLGFAAVLWATLTRASMGAFLLGCLLAVWVVSGWRTRLAGILLLGAAALSGTTTLREHRGLAWIDWNDPGTQYRLAMWKDGLKLTRDNPFFGVGMDSIKVTWRQWNIEAYKQFPLRSHFHSTPIQIAAERGLVTLGIWVWFWIAYFMLLMRLLRQTGRIDWSTRGLVLGFLGAACAFLASSLVHYNWGDSEPMMVFWLFVGCAVALERTLSKVEASPAKPPL